MELPTNSLASSPIRFLKFDSINKIFIAVLIASVVLGLVAGYLLTGTNKSSSLTSAQNTSNSNGTTAKAANQDTQTFRDFAEGTIQKRPASKNANDYAEGTHLLVRQGATPVALTSSVVDLSQYEGKKVKVLGETQKAVSEGWLMDVGKVEVQ